MLLGPIATRQLAFRARDGRFLIAAPGGVSWTALQDSPLTRYRLSHCEEDDYLQPLYPYPLDISGCESIPALERRRIERRIINLRLNPFVLTLGPVPRALVPPIHIPTFNGPFAVDVPFAQPHISLPHIVGPANGSNVPKAPVVTLPSPPGVAALMPPTLVSLPKIVGPLANQQLGAHGPAPYSMSATGRAGTVLITHGTAYTFGPGAIAAGAVPQVASSNALPHVNVPRVALAPTGVHVPPTAGTPLVSGPMPIVATPFVRPPVPGGVSVSTPPVTVPNPVVALPGYSVSTTGRPGTVLVTHGTSYTFGPGMIVPQAVTPRVASLTSVPRVNAPSIVQGPATVHGPPTARPPQLSGPMPIVATPFVRPPVPGGVSVSAPPVTVPNPVVALPGYSVSTTGRPGTVLVTHGTAYTFGPGMIVPQAVTPQVASLTSVPRVSPPGGTHVLSPVPVPPTAGTPPLSPPTAVVGPPLVRPPMPGAVSLTRSFVALPTPGSVSLPAPIIGSPKPIAALPGYSLSTTGRPGTVLITHGTAYTFGAGVVGPATIVRGVVVASLTAPQIGRPGTPSGHQAGIGVWSVAVPQTTIAPLALASPLIAPSAIIVSTGQPFGSATGSDPMHGAIVVPTVAGSTVLVPGVPGPAGNGFTSIAFATSQQNGAMLTSHSILNAATNQPGINAFVSQVTTFGLRR